MEVGRQRVLVRASTTARKQKKEEGASTLALKVVSKGTSKQKNERKDDCPLKKGPGTPAVDMQPKQALPPKPSQGVGKGLMTGKGPVA